MNDKSSFFTRAVFFITNFELESQFFDTSDLKSNLFIAINLCKSMTSVINVNFPSLKNCSIDIHKNKICCPHE